MVTDKVGEVIVVQKRGALEELALVDIRNNPLQPMARVKPSAVSALKHNVVN